MGRRAYRWLTALGMALVCLGGYLTWQSVSGGPVPAVPAAGALRSATVFADEQPLPAFRAVRDGGTFGNEQFRGRWSFLFFGYAHCADVCPTTLAVLQNVQQRLATRSLPRPQVAFLSVDPARDTPLMLKNYVSHFDPGFIAATGSDEALAPLVKHLGVHYVRHDREGARHYAVDHSAAIFLIDPKGRLRAVFSPPQDPADVAADYAVLTQ